MIPAELAHRIDNLIHLSQWHSIHCLVKCIEVCFDFFIVIRMILVVTFVQQAQNRVRITEAWRMLCNVLFQFLYVLFGIVMLVSPVQPLNA